MKKSLLKIGLAALAASFCGGAAASSIIQLPGLEAGLSRSMVQLGAAAEPGVSPEKVSSTGERARSATPQVIRGGVEGAPSAQAQPDSD